MNPLTTYQRGELKNKLALLVNCLFSESNTKFKNFVDGHVDVLEIGVFNLKRITGDDKSIDFFHFTLQPKRIEEHNKQNEILIKRCDNRERFNLMFTIPLMKPIQ